MTDMDELIRRKVRDSRANRRSLSAPVAAADEPSPSPSTGFGGGSLGIDSVVRRVTADEPTLDGIIRASRARARDGLNDHALSFDAIAYERLARGED